jgi:hypothetical protein
MSSISLNTGTQSLYTLLGNTNAYTQNSLLETLGASSSSDSSQQAGQVTLGPSGRHHNPDGVLFQKVQEAVTNALSSVQSGSTTDANQVVENAIASVLNPSGSTDSDGDNDGSGATSTSSASGSSSSTQAFIQALTNNGIDPQQFKNDFLTAVSQAQQTGQANPSTAFSSFPPGLTIDTAA